MKPQKSDRKNRRGNLLIHRSSQHTLLLYSNAFVLFVIIAIAWAIHISGTRLDAQLTQLNLPASHPFLQFVADRWRALNAVLAVVGVITIALLNVAGLTLSHRIAGPIHAVRLCMEEIAQGKEPRNVRIRNGDFFQELEAAYNRMAETLRARHRTKGL